MSNKQRLLKELERIYALYKIEIFTEMTGETVIQFQSGEQMEIPRHTEDIKYMQKELKDTDNG